MLSHSVGLESRKRSTKSTRSRSNSRSLRSTSSISGTARKRVPVSKGTQTLSRYFFTFRSNCRMASNLAETRIFLATLSSCLSVSTSTCEAETLRESPSRPNFTCRITVLCDRLCSCTSMGMVNAAIKHYSFRFQMNLLNLLSADQLDVTAETISSNHQAWCAVETGRPNISWVRQRSANSKAASWASSYLSKL